MTPVKSPRQSSFVSLVFTIAITLGFNVLPAFSQTPVMTFSSFGSPYDTSHTVATDVAGNSYVAGSTADGHAFVKMYDNTNTLRWTKAIAGNGAESVWGMTVDSSSGTSAVYVTGTTSSTDLATSLPMPANAMQRTPTGGMGHDAFVALLNPVNGVILYATYLGGTDTYGNSISLSSCASQSTGSICDITIAGVSNSAIPSFPATQNGNGFVARLHFSATAATPMTRTWGAYIPNVVDRTGDNLRSLAVAASGTDTVFVAGASMLTAVNNAAKTVAVAFVEKLVASGTTVSYRFNLDTPTYRVNNPYKSYANGVAVDTNGNPYVTGAINSPNLPINCSGQPFCQSSINWYSKPNVDVSTDAFYVRVNDTAQTISYATYLGGGTDAKGSDSGNAITLDGSNNVFIVGETGADDFPNVGSLVGFTGRGTVNGFLTTFTPANAIAFSSYVRDPNAPSSSFGQRIEGVTVDSAGNLFVTGTSDIIYGTETPFFVKIGSPAASTPDFTSLQICQITPLTCNNSGALTLNVAGISLGTSFVSVAVNMTTPVSVGSSVYLDTVNDAGAVITNGLVVVSPSVTVTNNRQTWTFAINLNDLVRSGVGSINLRAGIGQSTCAMNQANQGRCWASLSLIGPPGLVPVSFPNGNQAIGGNPAVVTGTVTLSQPNPLPLTVFVTATNPALTPNPFSTSTIVAGGATSATFNVTTLAVQTVTPIAFTSSFSSAVGGSTDSAVGTLLLLPDLKVTDGTNGTPISLSLNSALVYSGGSVRATVTLSAPVPVDPAYPVGIPVALHINTPAGGAVQTITATIPKGGVTAVIDFVPTVSAHTTYNVVAEVLATPGTSNRSVSNTLSLNVDTVGSVSVTPTSLSPGATYSATFTLTGAAPAGGTQVQLTQANGTVTAATIAAGQTSATVTGLVAPSQGGTYTVSATINGNGATANLTVIAPYVSNLTLSSTAALVGSTVTATATLSVAPASAVTVTFTLPDGVTTKQITIAAGVTTGSTTFAAPTVAGTFTVKAVASTSITTSSSTLNVVGITLAPNATAVLGGGSVGVTATLSGALVPAAPVTLTLTPSWTATTGTVTIAANSTSGSTSFTAPTAAGNDTVSTTVNGVITTSPVFTVVALNNITLSPGTATIVAGTPITAIAVLTGNNPSAAFNVTLTPSWGSAVTVAIANGSASSAAGTFTAPTATGAYTISATVNGVTKTASFNVVSASVLSGITLSPSTILPGGLVTVTATVNNPVTSPVSVTFTPPGGTLQTITISTGTTGTATFSAPAAAGNYLISATSNGVSVSASLTVAGLSLTPTGGASTTVLGGSNVSLTATLTNALVPAAAVNLTLTPSWGGTAVVLPIASGSTSAATTIAMPTAAGSYTVSTTVNGVVVTSPVYNVVALSGITLTPGTASVLGGTAITAVATLSGNNPSTPVSVTLTPSWGSSVTVSIPTGSATSSTASLVAPTAPGTYTVTTTVNGVSKSVSFTVIGLGSLTLTPTSVNIGGTVSATVALSSPNQTASAISIPLTLSWNPTAVVTLSIPVGSATPTAPVTFTAPATGGTYSVSASLNGVSSSPVTLTVINIGSSTAFKSFTTKVSVAIRKGPGNDNFLVRGQFVLGTGGTIDPLTDAVTLKFNTYSVTLPAGSFKLNSDNDGDGDIDEHGCHRSKQYKFKGVVSGVSLDIRIRSFGNNEFDLHVEGKGADLTAVNKGQFVPVTLTIGNDTGTSSTDAKLRFHDFDADVDIDLSKVDGQDKFHVDGDFTLDDLTDGINPLSQDVFFQIGPYSVTVPAGSFRTDGYQSWRFDGTINGVQLSMRIRHDWNNQYDLTVDGKSLDMGDIQRGSTVAVKLTVGNDGDETVDTWAYVH